MTMERSIRLDKVPDVVLLRGDATTAYRDPAVVFVDGVFHLFFTLVKTDAFGRPCLFTAVSTSRDLCGWSSPDIVTPQDVRQNYSSPGNIIRYNGEWVLCLQTYPR